MRVLVVDDNAVVRLGLRTLLESEPDISVVGEASDGDEALRLARQVAPDVVLLDVRMPRRDGLSAVAELSGLSRVLMLTFSDEQDGIRRAMADGACGYLVHGTFDASVLASMVRSAAAGVITLTATAARALGDADQPSTAPPRRHLVEHMSPRQVEVMELVAQGRSNREIAASLFLAEKTVKNHINQIFASLGVTTRAEAIVAWTQPGRA